MDSPYRETPPLAEQLAEAKREIERLKRKPARHQFVVRAMVSAALAVWQSAWILYAVTSDSPITAAVNGVVLAWHVYFGAHWYRCATEEDPANV